MSATDDKLEILIGRLLDGEISPAEQRWLDDELERNEEARALLGQLRTLDACARQALTTDIHDDGNNPEEILQRAWQRHEGFSWRRVIRADGHLRFAVGLAAGFVLGLLLHFVLVSGAAPATSPASPPPLAREDPDTTAPTDDTGSRDAVAYPEPVMRNVDWYSFTDQTGNQWLVEGIREGSVRPAVYYGDL